MRVLIWSVILFFSGCGTFSEKTAQPEIVVKRTETRYQESKPIQVTETSVTLKAPLVSEDPSGVSIDGISATMGGAVQPKHQNDFETEKKIFYGCAAVLGLLSLGFIWFKHFKLAGLSAIGAGAVVLAGNVVVNYSQQLAYATAIGGVGVLGFLGWKLWEDYKEK